jgi:hypothetical protein
MQSRRRRHSEGAVGKGERQQPTTRNAVAPDGIPNAAVAPAEVFKNGDFHGIARVLHLEEGLFAVTVGPLAAPPSTAAEIALPATGISVGAAQDRAPVEIVSSSGKVPCWFSAEGGTIIAKAPPEGGFVVITTFGLQEGPALPQLRILRLDQLDASPAGPAPVRSPRSVSPIRVEMIAHIEREGDRQLLVEGWVGSPGKRMRMEAFAIRPLETIAPGDIEYMALGLGNRRTPWVTDAKLCGTRGRGLALTGFAVRLAPAMRGQFDVLYEGSFFSGSTIGPNRNGEPCVSLIADDPLEAIRLRIIKRNDA